MNNTIKYILIGIGVLFVVVVIFGMIINDDKKQVELTPLEYSVSEPSPYGIQHEGLKFWVELDYTKFKEDDYRRLAAKVIEDYKDSYKYSEFTVFIADTTNYLPSHALFRLEAKEKRSNLDENSFIFEHVGDYYKDRDTKVEIKIAE